MNEIEHLVVDDDDESEYQPSENSENSNKKIKKSVIWLLVLQILTRRRNKR